MITCEFENGKKANLRHITVAAIVINEKDEFLLTKRAPDLTGGGLYCLPSGFLDRGENMKTAVIRELEEETGITGRVSFLFRINDNPNRPKEDRQNVDVVFVVEPSGGNIKLNSEVTDIQWFSRENLPSEEEFAFDHRENIMEYLRFKKEKFDLPIFT